MQATLEPTPEMLRDEMTPFMAAHDTALTGGMDLETAETVMGLLGVSDRGDFLIDVSDVSGEGEAKTQALYTNGEDALEGEPHLFLYQVRRPGEETVFALGGTVLGASHYNKKRELLQAAELGLEVERIEAEKRQKVVPINGSRNTGRAA